ncbi:Trans-aconitate methyltransferase [Legionella busanensis]|uniref:Trans-aconitate methyltransferase n=1 Tax=Legionella busanensis TaxID=190655 RepID=A0A378JK66_9GAMM|nr:class I SAM-dependent methyltransferase [Legionella busanensis]STX51131.1 Trans-aconitate methyltransferase [Legionella busanensis]
MDKKSKQLFLGDAQSYTKARPNYPAQLFSTLFEYAKPSLNTKPFIIVDVGCGTGIATRGIYASIQKNTIVFGIEPNLRMLAEANKIGFNKNLIFIAGQAENLPLEHSTVDIILVAQAMQYFNRQIFYTEAQRVLRTNGTIAIIENNRNWQASPFLEYFEIFLEKNSYDINQKHYSRNYRAFPFKEELTKYFANTMEKQVNWVKDMAPEAFWEMAKSSTSGQQAINNLSEKVAKQKLLKLANNYLDQHGMLNIPYMSKIYLAKKM